MKVSKKVSVGGAYAKKAPYEYQGQKYEADIKDGDRVEILTSGQEVTGTYGDQIVFSIRTRNGERNIAFNQKSMNVLIDEWGDETAAWVGKAVCVTTVKAMVQGKFQTVAYFCPEGYQMDEEGNFRKAGSEELSVEDVPF